MRFPGNPYEWWLEQVTEDETLVATAIEMIEDRS